MKPVKLDWFEVLKKQFPGMVLRKATKSASAASKDPREAVITLINNSVMLLDDPTHTVTKRGNTYTPESCVRVANGEHLVTLSYCREKLTFPDGNEEMVIEADNAATLLGTLKEMVEAGHFDEQLARIKAARVAKLTGKAGSQAKAASTSKQKKAA